MLVLDQLTCKITCKIPLTTTSGKIRVKRRESVNQYGIPVATRRENFSQNHYIEWQISYDVRTDDIPNVGHTTLANKKFIGANTETKSLYELSEIVYHFSKFGAISRSTLVGIKNFIITAGDNELIDVNPDFKINRSFKTHNNLFGIEFENSIVSYPLLIHRFENSQIITEVVIREKQRAVGVMPMLYLCFPITELVATEPLLGRTAMKKETADFIFDKSKIEVLLEIIKIFGILSASHKHDISSIIDLIINDL